METKISELPLVKVQFSSKSDPTGFSVREYTYRTAIPLQLGDAVNAPTKRGELTARVSTVDPDLIIEPTFALQTIIEFSRKKTEDEDSE